MADKLKAPDANSILRLDGASGLRSSFDYAGGGMPTAYSLRPTPYRWRDLSAMPKRKWIMGRYLLRGAVSMTIGTGGTGKSAMALAEAVALASGRDLLQGGVIQRACVWCWNLEEPMDELSIRVQAICQHYGVSEQALAGSLYIDSGLDRPLCLARPGPAGQFEIIEDVFTGLETAICQQGIDVLVIDPLVSSHQLDENNNMQMDALMKRLSQLAAVTGCAVSVVHHTRKPGTDTKTTTDSARGAKALTDAARIVRVLNPMTAKEATGFSVEPAGFLSARLDKQNYAAAQNEPQWFKMTSVALDDDDEVGVIQHWRPPSMTIDVSNEQIKQIQKRCSEEQPGAYPTATDAAYRIVAEQLNLNTHDDVEKMRAKTLLKKLLREGYLVEGRGPKKGKAKSETRPIILAGQEPGV